MTGQTVANSCLVVFLIARSRDCRQVDRLETITSSCRCFSIAFSRPLRETVWKRFVFCNLQLPIILGSRSGIDIPYRLFLKLFNDSVSAADIMQRRVRQEYDPKWWLVVWNGEIKTYFKLLFRYYPGVNEVNSGNVRTAGNTANFRIFKTEISHITACVNLLDGSIYN
jgi:hypothetical protein